MCTYIKQYHKGCWHKVLLVTETNRCAKARRNGFDCPKTEDTVCIDAETEGVCEFCGEFRLEMEQQMLEEERMRTEARQSREEVRETKESTRPKKWTWRSWFGKSKSEEEVKVDDVVDDLHVRLGSVRLDPPQPPKPSTW